jgi:hypothetical protein
MCRTTSVDYLAQSTEIFYLSLTISKSSIHGPPACINTCVLVRTRSNVVVTRKKSSVHKQSATWMTLDDAVRLHLYAMNDDDDDDWISVSLFRESMLTLYAMKPKLQQDMTVLFDIS